MLRIDSLIPQAKNDLKGRPKKATYELKQNSKNSLNNTKEAKRGRTVEKKKKDRGD